VTSVLLSGSFVSLIVFLFKKTIEKGIETRFKEIENKQRQSKIFDDQYEIYKSVIALTYRVRNGSRDIVDELDKASYNLLFIEDLLKLQNEYFKALRDLMLDNRAILPELVFKELHDLSHAIDYFNRNIMILARQNKDLAIQEIQIIISSAKEKYKKIDDHYYAMTGIVQSVLGLKSK